MKEEVSVVIVRLALRQVLFVTPPRECPQCHSELVVDVVGLSAPTISNRCTGYYYYDG